MGGGAKGGWPWDLRIFAVLSALWSAAIATRAVAYDMYFYTVTDPLQAVIGGIKFYGGSARVVLLIQAGIFAAFAFAILGQYRWGLVLALAYFVQVVIGHFVFILAYMHDVHEADHVRMAALEGPIPTLILLYLWIRWHDLLFQAPGKFGAGPARGSAG